MQGDRDFHTLSDYIRSFVITYLYIENKFGKMNEKKQKNALPGNLMMRVSLLYSNFFWKISTIQNVHIRICREFHGLSKYVITFLKMLFYDDDIPKIQCLTYFFQADIRKVVKQGVVVNIVLVKNDHYSSFHAFSLCKSLNFD